MKNSRGGQEGSEGPGVATAQSPEPISLCYLAHSGLEIKERGESPEKHVRLQRNLSGETVFLFNNNVCEHERAMRVDTAAITIIVSFTVNRLINDTPE